MIEILEIFGCDGMIMIEFSVAFMKHGLIERYHEEWKNDPHDEVHDNRLLKMK